MQRTLSPLIKRNISLFCWSLFIHLVLLLLLSLLIKPVTITTPATVYHPLLLRFQPTGKPKKLTRQHTQPPLGSLKTRRTVLKKLVVKPARQHHQKIKQADKRTSTKRIKREPPLLKKTGNSSQKSFYKAAVTTQEYHAPQHKTKQRLERRETLLEQTSSSQGKPAFNTPQQSKQQAKQATPLPLTKPTKTEPAFLKTMPHAKQTTREKNAPAFTRQQQATRLIPQQQQIRYPDTALVQNRTKQAMSPHFLDKQGNNAIKKQNNSPLPKATFPQTIQTKTIAQKLPLIQPDQSRKTLQKRHSLTLKKEKTVYSSLSRFLEKFQKTTLTPASQPIRKQQYIAPQNKRKQRIDRKESSQETRPLTEQPAFSTPRKNQQQAWYAKTTSFTKATKKEPIHQQLIIPPQTISPIKTQAREKQQRAAFSKNRLLPLLSRNQSLKRQKRRSDIKDSQNYYKAGDKQAVFTLPHPDNLPFTLPESAALQAASKQTTALTHTSSPLPQQFSNNLVQQTFSRSKKAQKNQTTASAHQRNRQTAKSLTSNQQKFQKLPPTSRGYPHQYQPEQRQKQLLVAPETSTAYTAEQPRQSSYNQTAMPQKRGKAEQKRGSLFPDQKRETEQTTASSKKSLSAIPTAYKPDKNLLFARESQAPLSKKQVYQTRQRQHGQAPIRGRAKPDSLPAESVIKATTPTKENNGNSRTKQLIPGKLLPRSQPNQITTVARQLIRIAQSLVTSKETGKPAVKGAGNPRHKKATNHPPITVPHQARTLKRATQRTKKSRDQHWKQTSKLQKTFPHRRMFKKTTKRREVWVSYLNRELAGDIFIYSIAVEKKQVWLGTDQGLIRFDGRRFHRYQQATGFPAQQVYTLKISNKGVIWIGTDKGILKRENKQIITIPGTNDLQVFSIDLSKEGVLWAATNNGLFSYQKETMTYRADAPADLLLFSLAQRSSGNVLLGTGAAVYQYNQQSTPGWQRTTTTDQPVLTVAEDSLKRIWYGTETGGAYTRQGSWTAIPSAPGGQHSSIYQILPLKQGGVWLATDQGAGYFYRNKWRWYGKGSGFTGKKVYAIGTAGKGVFWFATDRGLAKLTVNN